jgi:hypothetical protein
MSYELEVNLPNVPKGEMVEITGLGTYENGKTSPVPDDLLELYKLNNQTVEEDDKGNEVVVVPSLGKLNFPEGIKAHRTKTKATPTKLEDNKPEGGN